MWAMITIEGVCDVSGSDPGPDVASPQTGFVGSVELDLTRLQIAMTKYSILFRHIKTLGPSPPFVS